ncbi:Phosphate transport (Pho88) [Trypanosoma brucei equiperdum]|uniref:Phosphate transport (Pho88) n=1 Tax=Trypanosoma brucei equiperdum TaxID=630700 RepID=A0A3L6KUM0_9TRYP|nr:Phosphate transport (Pho88) [Trypanosoma brucei equiperdum]
MNIILIGLVMVTGWSIDKTDPEVQSVVQYMFYSVHAVLAAVMIYMFSRIWDTKDTRMLQVKDTYTGGWERMTVSDYDFGKWREMFFLKMMLPVCIGLFVALRWEMPLVLLVQCVTNPIVAWNAPVTQLYLRGFKEEGPLVRPWKDEVATVEWMREMFGLAREEQDKFLSGQNGTKGRKGQ